MSSRDTRPISWIRAARKAFDGFPEGAQTVIMRALTVAAEGRKADIAKPLKGFGSGVFEVALKYRTDAYRTVYALQLGERLWVLHAFHEEGEAGHQDREEGYRFDPRAAETIEEGVTAMNKTDDDFELVHGSGNVFRDFGRADADVQQTKALLAARIIGILDDEGLSTRKAEGRTGVSHADFTRIRNVQLDRFTIDRLMTVLNKLGQHVDVQIDVHPRVAAEEAPVHS